MSHQAELLDSKFLEPQSPKRVFIYFHIGIEIRLALLQAMLIERHFGAKTCSIGSNLDFGMLRIPKRW